jgi:peroxin-14
LIAPPTPPQLEQDKAAIDEQFNRAFALLDTLSSDTAALKEAEEARTQRLDTAIADVEAIVAELKAANSRREEDSRRMELDIKGLKESLPRAIDSVREGSEKQLRELSNELGSLKLLMGNRMGSGTSNPFAGTHSMPSRQPADGTIVARSGTATPATETTPGSAGNVTGPNSTTAHSSFAAPSSSYPGSTAAAAMSSTAARPKSTTSFGAAGGKAAIPAWQMAAASKAKELQVANSSVGPNGTSPAPPADGAEAVAALQAS